MAKYMIVVIVFILPFSSFLPPSWKNKNWMKEYASFNFWMKKKLSPFSSILIFPWSKHFTCYFWFHFLMFLFPRSFPHVNIAPRDEIWKLYCILFASPDSLRIIYCFPVSVEPRPPTPTTWSTFSFPLANILVKRETRERSLVREKLENG